MRKIHSPIGSPPLSSAGLFICPRHFSHRKKKQFWLPLLQCSIPGAKSIKWRERKRRPEREESAHHSRLKPILMSASIFSLVISEQHFINILKPPCRVPVCYRYSSQGNSEIYATLRRTEWRIIINQEME